MKTVVHTITPLLEQAQRASKAIQRLSDAQRQALLLELADVIDASQALIMAENQRDLDRMEDGNPRKDRLLLTPERIHALAEGVRAVCRLPDPSGVVLSDYQTPEGLKVQKVSVPLGVVGVIYESRPNVTIDVAALCLRAGNACVLRGGSDAEYSNQLLVALIHQAMAKQGLPTEAVCLLPTDRNLVKAFLEAKPYVDVMIPRGSQQLIDFVRTHSLIPTIETGAGVCHTYVHQAADLEKAAAIVVNAKVSRPSVCNALDTVLVDEAVAEAFLPMILSDLQVHEVEVFADARAHALLSEAAYPYLHPAREEDFGREFLSFKCSIRVVADMDRALEHIQRYSSKHSEAIVSEAAGACERFLQEVDAAAVYTNASTRFTDGGKFGLGAEIGIATQKLHARGPFALEKLVTEKWIIKGDGQVRL